MIFILLRSYPAYAYAYADAYADAYNLLRSCVCPRADKLLTGPQTVVAQVLQRLIHFMLLCWAPLLQIPILPFAGLACSTNIHRQNSNPDFDFLARPAPAGRVFSPRISDFDRGAVRWLGESDSCMRPPSDPHLHLAHRYCNLRKPQLCRA